MTAQTSGALAGDAMLPDLASRRTLAAAFVAAVLSVTPAFLLGSVAVLVRAEMGFGEARLGLCITAYYLASTLAAVPGGRLAERLGGLRGCSVGIVVSVVSLLAVASLARNWWQLALCLALGGVANALLQPATNLALARRMPADRLGLSVGTKMANGPVATLLAGVSASVIAVTVGWRWAFVAIACLAAVFFVVRPPGWREDPPYRAAPDDAADSPLAPLVLISLASAFAVSATGSLVGFSVESAVAGGLSVATAGWLLALGSAAGTLARPALGWLVDRRRTTGFGMISVLMVVGSVAFVLLGARAGTPLLALTTVVAFVAGWGWPGLLWFAVVRTSPSAPGKATGVAIVGTSLGGMVGPTIFGFLVERSGYTVAWSVAAVALLFGAVCVGLAALMLRRAGVTAGTPGTA